VIQRETSVGICIKEIIIVWTKRGAFNPDWIASTANADLAQVMINTQHILTAAFFIKYLVLFNRMAEDTDPDLRQHCIPVSQTGQRHVIRHIIGPVF